MISGRPHEHFEDHDPDNLYDVAVPGIQITRRRPSHIWTERGPLPVRDQDMLSCGVRKYILQ